MSYVPLICTETGEIDRLEIVKRAPVRAAREYGSPSFPPSYLREALEWLTDRAEAERRQWRQERCLPEEHTVILMSLPGWGASGDSFTRDR